MTPLRSLFLAAALALSAASPAAAASDTVALDLGYSGRLYIKVLEIGFRQQISPTRHASQAHLVSSGILSAFRKLDVRSHTQGPIVDGRPQPGDFMHENLDGRRNRRVEVSWRGNDVVTAVTPNYSTWGDPPATREQKLGAADPLTQLARLMLAHGPAGPCQGTARFFGGKELYDLGFSNPQPIAISKADQKLGLVNGLRCAAVYRELAGFKRKTGKDANTGINRPIIVDFAQVGQDGPWIVSRLQAHTPLGPAVIDLTRLSATRQASP